MERQRRSERAGWTGQHQRRSAKVSKEEGQRTREKEKVREDRGRQTQMGSKKGR